MCGICGVYCFSGEVNRRQIEKMNNVQAHRGPDGEGIYISSDEKVGFGHRRLAILDLSPTGHQPMSNADGTVWITFNGEIYNYLEFVPELKNKGYKFHGTSDTEAILYAYEEYGEKCLDLFRGMFAFAIWDSQKNRLFIARDRVGEKPLYYARFGNSFYFASELPAILEGSQCPREIDPEGLHMYFLYNLHHVPEPYSIIKGIRKLPPAHYLIIDNKGIHIKKYWNLSYFKEGKSYQEYIDEYKRLAAECVQLREISDVPISALLSGGVDSSTIVALMKNKNLSTFSIGVCKDDSELLRARLVSNLFKTKNNEIIFKEEFVNKLPQLIFYYGEPYNLMPALYSYVLSEEMKKKVKVTLSGNGADEIFYGYDSSNELLLLTLLEKFVPHFFARFLAALIPSKYQSIKLSLLALSSPRNKQKGNIYRYLGNRLKVLYSPNIQKKLSSFDEGNIMDKSTMNCDSSHLIERFYHVGLMVEDAHSVTIVADTTGMAHGLEIRAPFLDHKMIEFAARLPLRMKIHSLFNKKLNKYIMKKSMEGVLPNEILYGKKMGFGYNIKWNELLRTKWKNLVERALLKDLPKTGLFNENYLKQLYSEVLLQEKNGTQLVWGLINFYIWHEIFINKKDYKEMVFV